MPGVRHFTAVVAGMTNLEYPVFARYAYSGALLWVTTFLTLGYVIGDTWRTAAENIHQVVGVIAVIAAVAIAIFLFVRSKSKA